MMEPEYQVQATRFLDWFSRLPQGTSRGGAFGKWSDSKDFHPEDRKVIWDLVQKDAPR